MIKYLVSRSSSGKVRSVYLSCDEIWHDELGGFVIERKHGYHNGKMQYAPEIIIHRGKAGRTHREQLALQFNSELKSYLDKGYKEINDDPEIYSEAVLLDIIGEAKTDPSGMLKPMLAKSSKDIKTKGIFDKNYWASVKINGVRCLIYFDGKQIRTSSRGATNYDFPMNHILTHPSLIEFFKEYPDEILDGEIYVPGWTLNQISGVCRTQKTAHDGDILEYYLYDVIDLKRPFIERLGILYQIQKDLDLEVLDIKNPHTNWSDGDLKIKFVPHYKVSGWDNIKKLHDGYVSYGWEGVVLREETSLYKPGIRNNSWIKVKEYIDAEYPIIGWEPGLRDEDMCFVCKTPNGFDFKVKPMGTREQKLEYINNIESLIGKQLTVKYFEMSGAGTDIPQQPVGIAIRDYE